MTEVYNATPFPHLSFSNSDNQGREFGVFMIKAAFDIAEDGTCTISDDQEPFSFTDQCYGEVNLSSLRLPSDLVSFKPGADIIVDAVAHAPEGRPAQSWIAGVTVRIGDRILATKRLQVSGPRQWTPHWFRQLSQEEQANWKARRKLFKGWTLSDPQPTEKVPLRYELAYGGSIEKGTGDDGNPIVEAFEQNPIGCGWIDSEWSDHTVEHHAPQITAVAAPITSAYQHQIPAGFGAIPAAWLPRRSLGGTFDQNWIDNVSPRWPDDYDFAFNNSAAHGLVLDEHPDGPLIVELQNMRPRGGSFTLSLPDPMPILMISSEDGGVSAIRPRLDTIFISVSAEDLFDCRVLLTWRMAFNMSSTSRIVAVLPSTQDPAERGEMAGLTTTSPHPEACAVFPKIEEEMV